MAIKSVSIRSARSARSIRPAVIALSITTLLATSSSMLFAQPKKENHSAKTGQAEKTGRSTKASQSQKIIFTDIKGRKITLNKPATRLMIDDGRYLVALSILFDDPSKVLAAWGRDIHRVGEKTYAQYVKLFPAIDKIPQVGNSAESFSLEQAIAAKPDLALISATVGLTDEQVQKLESAGIKVVYIDFASQPFRNLDRSLEILGMAVGKADRAREFINYRRAKLNVIQDRLRFARNVKEPKVFFEAHAGVSEDCCNSPGTGNIGEYISMVRGKNIAAPILNAKFGKISLEYVIGQRPDIYIATGGPHLEKSGGLVLGEGYSKETSKAALRKVSRRAGIAELPAVKNGRFYGLSHQLLNSPVDILAVEALAKWTHPGLFADLNLDKTLAEINKRFLAVPYRGTYWVEGK